MKNLGIVKVGAKVAVRSGALGPDGFFREGQLVRPVGCQKQRRFVKHLVDLLARTIDNRARPTARASSAVAITAARVRAASTAEVVARRMFVGVHAVALGMIAAVAAEVVLRMATTARQFHLRLTALTGFRIPTPLREILGAERRFAQRALLRHRRGFVVHGLSIAGVLYVVKG